MAIGLDVGSSGIKAVRIGSSGRVLAISRRPLAARRARGGRVEHDPRTILAAARAALRAVPGLPNDRLGIATQRSTILFWDRDTGRPLTPAYSWQDRRAAALCDRLRRKKPRRGARAGPGLDAWIHERTGLRLSPHYSASKLAWALGHVPGLRKQVASGRALWGTLGSFLLWHWTSGSVHAIDHANAQRTLLLGLDSLDWSPDLFHLFGLEALLEAPALPDLLPTFASNEIPLDIAGRGRRHGPESSFRLGAMTGDQQAAILGLGGGRPGSVVINYGTGAFVLVEVGAIRVSVPGLLTTLLASWPSGAARTGPRRAPSHRALYAIEGSVNAAGAAIEWAQARLGLRVPVADLDAYFAGKRARRGGVFFLPAVAGLGAPHWDPGARPRFSGDFRGATRADRLLAVIESIAFRCTEIFRRAARATGRRHGDDPIVVAGGLTRCRTLVQAQADLLQRPLVLRDAAEATAVGAALLARPSLVGGALEPAAGRDGGRLRSGSGAGARGSVIHPRISRDEAEARFAAWSKAVHRA